MSRSVLLVSYLALVIGLITYNYFAGQDVNWDQVSYHNYAGHLALNNGRLDQDFFPASVQSYLVPYSYVPFYLLVKSGVSPLAASSLLVLLHSANVVLLWWVAKNLSAHAPKRRRNAVALAGVAMGVLSPIFLVELGSSFNDIIVSIPVVAAFGVLTSQWSVWRKGACAGLLAGVAVALKLTSIPFAIGLALAILAEGSRSGFRQSLGSSVTFVLAMLAAFASVAGYWSLLLWTEFGNPLFPFFNGLFRSEDYLPENIRHFRYLPGDPWGILALPFRMTLPTANIYTETFAPDVRFAMCIVAGAVALMLAAFKRRLGRSWTPISSFYFAVAVSFVVWGATSGNGRYLLPLTLLIGPAVVFAFAQIGPRASAYGLVLVFFLQILGLAFGADRRWTQVGWDGEDWFSTEFTERFRSQRSLYLSVDPQPAAFVVPFSSRESAFVNVVGQHTLSLDGPGGRRLVALLEKYSDSIRVSFTVSNYDENLQPRLPKDVVDDRLSALGLRADFYNCEFSKFRKLGGTRLLISPGGESNVRLISDVPFMLLANCPTTPSEVSRATAAERETAVRFFVAAERACPTLLQPSGGMPYLSAGAWEKFYINTDVTMRFSGMKLWLSGYMIPAMSLDVEDVLGGKCPPLDRRAYRVGGGG